MSRIGKKEIVIPKQAKLSVKDGLVKVNGPKGELSYQVDSKIKINVDGDKLNLTLEKVDQAGKSAWGLSRTLINNMIVGVTEGYTKKLEFKGVGYKATVSGSVLVLNLGYSHPIEYSLPKGVEAKVKGNVIDLSSHDKELLGFVAAKVRSFRPPEPYKGKGIAYSTETIIRKAGKTGGKK